MTGLPLGDSDGTADNGDSDGHVDGGHDAVSEADVWLRDLARLAGGSGAGSAPDAPTDGSPALDGLVVAPVAGAAGLPRRLEDSPAPGEAEETTPDVDSPRVRGVGRIDGGGDDEAHGPEEGQDRGRSSRRSVGVRERRPQVEVEGRRASRRGAAGTSRRTAAPEEDPNADPESLARTIALRKLTAQARTRQELEQALARRQVPAEAAGAVLDRLEDVGLVDDERFARDWVESRQARRHLSRRALRRELQTRGVDREVIEEALSPVGVDDELAAARVLASRKLRTMSGLDAAVRRRRLAGVLGRRGFSGAIISRVLDESSDGADPEE